MHTFLYILWFLLPTIFFVLALWAKLEQMSGSAKKQDPRDFFRQGIFCLACVLVCVIIDGYVLQDFVDNFAPSFMTLGFFQVILLPIVLVIGASVVGPTAGILIQNSGRTGRSKKRR